MLSRGCIAHSNKHYKIAADNEKSFYREVINYLTNPLKSDSQGLTQIGASTQ